MGPLVNASWKTGTVAVPFSRAECSPGRGPGTKKIQAEVHRPRIRQNGYTVYPPWY